MTVRRPKTARFAGILIPVAVLVLVPLGVDAAATKAPATTEVVDLSSPSGTIVCQIDWNGAGASEVICQTSTRQAILQDNGDLTRASGSNAFTAITSAGAPQVLGYGKHLAVGTFACSSAPVGMTCTEGSRGFRISSAVVDVLGSGPTTTLVGLSSSGEFISPSGAISCEIDWQRTGLPNALTCDSLSPPRVVTMTPGGRWKTCSGVSCNIGNASTSAPVLAVGTSTGAGPYQCTSTSSGIDCTVDGVGFLLTTSGASAYPPPKVPSFRGSSPYPLLQGAKAIGTVTAIAKSGRYAEVLLSCGIDSGGNKIAAKSHWTVDLASLKSLEYSDSPSGETATLARELWVAEVRRYGFTGAFDLQNGIVTNGPYTQVCG